MMGQKEVFLSYHYMACHAVIVNGADKPDQLAEWQVTWHA